MTVATPNEQQSNRPLHKDWGVIIFMTVLHVAAVFAFLPGNFSWGAVALFLFMHWLTAAVGVTLGWHRLIAHRSFQVPKWFEYFCAFCGTLSCQGGPIWWVGLHRHHHLYSDQEPDHHNSMKGFWWSHMGWMFFEVPAESEVPRFTKDIGNDPIYQFLDKYFIPLQIVLAGLFYLWGGWSFVLWGIVLRLVVVYHSTWFVNSATHKFGYRTYESSDRSTNCWWVALLSYGEGWHNNHHTFQYSARHGLKWWEIDITWMMIRTLQFLGLATNVKLIDEKAM